MASKARRARRILTGAGIDREDSDDELGVEDLSWDWIYAAGNGDDQRQIVGAKFGSFKCMIGDCVLLKAEGYKEAWVAIICEFCEDETGEGEKSANFMWFSSDKEIRNREKKRADALKNELYITPAFDINPLTSINGSAKVVSLARFQSSHPSSKGNSRSKTHSLGKTFICRRGCNVRTATYTDEFLWEDLYQGAGDLGSLITRIRAETKATRSNRKGPLTARKDATGPNSDNDTQNDEVVPSTPRKRRKLDAPPGARSNAVGQRRPLKYTTPTRKRTLVRKPLEFTPLGTRMIASDQTNSPFQIARMRLHVSSVPISLPCREDIFSQVYTHLEAAISEGSGSCIYISGTPGTGKTATVREAVSQLHTAVQAEELDDFIFVEINGMKVTDPHQAYSMLWEALEGDRVSPSHALDLLEREFSHPSPRRVPCVVLMDELDQLVTKNQSVMYNFFNWPGLRHSRLIVIAVANTMDLPERTLSNKISSRLGLTRITFPGYSHDQLIKIIQSRLEGVSGQLVEPDAIQFASRKVAAVSGDARRALDICRRAVEIAELAKEDQLPPTPSKNTNGSRSDSLQRQYGRVTIGTIKQAIAETTSSPLQECLKLLPVAAKALLAALLSRMRRSGVSDNLVADVVEETKRLCTTSDGISAQQSLLTQMPEAEGAHASEVYPALSAPRVLGIGEAIVELEEAGVINLETMKGERIGKIRLNISMDEVKLALNNDPDVQDLGFS